MGRAAWWAVLVTALCASLVADCHIEAEAPVELGGSFGFNTVTSAVTKKAMSAAKVVPKAVTKAAKVVKRTAKKAISAAAQSAKAAVKKAKEEATKLEGIKKKAADVLRIMKEQVEGCKETVTSLTAPPFVAKKEPDTPHANWMGNNKNIENKTLTELSLPGTHDSGSYQLFADKATQAPSAEAGKFLKQAKSLGVPVAITKSFETALVNKWAVTQRKTIYSQLKDGIRFLDIRACFFDKMKSWIVHHGVAPGNKLSVLLNDARRFIQEHPKEIVLVKISHFTQCQTKAPTEQQKTDLFKMIKQTFKHNLVKKATGLKSSIRELAAKNQRVLVSVQGLAVNDPDIFGAGTVLDDYANSNDIGAMETHNTALVQKSKPTSGKLSTMSWTLTPNAANVKSTFTPCAKVRGAPRSLLEMAQKCNAAFPKWAAANPMHNHLNLVLFDNPTPEAISAVVSRQRHTPTMSRWMGDIDSRDVTAADLGEIIAPQKRAVKRQAGGSKSAGSPAMCSAKLKSMLSALGECRNGVKQIIAKAKASNHRIVQLAQQQQQRALDGEKRLLNRKMDSALARRVSKDGTKMAAKLASARVMMKTRYAGKGEHRLQAAKDAKSAAMKALSGSMHFSHNEKKKLNKATLLAKSYGKEKIQAAKRKKQRVLVIREMAKQSKQRDEDETRQRKQMKQLAKSEAKAVARANHRQTKLADLMEEKTMMQEKDAAMAVGLKAAFKKIKHLKAAIAAMKGRVKAVSKKHKRGLRDVLKAHGAFKRCSTSKIAQLKAARVAFKAAVKKEGPKQMLANTRVELARRALAMCEKRNKGSTNKAVARLKQRTKRAVKREKRKLNKKKAKKKMKKAVKLKQKLKLKKKLKKKEAKKEAKKVKKLVKKKLSPKCKACKKLSKAEKTVLGADCKAC